jgi:small redox-active disulfide protein 2
MLIKILGPGCANCHALERLTRDALADLNLMAEVSRVTDYPTIVGYGVMSTPALVVDERVVLAGRLPTAAEIRDRLADAIPRARAS